MMSVDPQGYRTWHDYLLQERHATWKVFLPILADKPILAVGLDRNSLGSLARSWQTISVCRCQEADLQWVREQGHCLKQDYCLELVGNQGLRLSHYPAIAVDARQRQDFGPEKVMSLLQPGGSAAWIGRWMEVPETARLSQSGYESVHRYAFLPPGKGKTLISLNDRNIAQSGLNFYQPGKWQNRLAVRLGVALARLGMQYMLGLKQVVIARKPGSLPREAYLLNWLGEAMNITLTDATVFAGWRNLTLQLFDRQGSFIGVAKIADTGLGKQAVENETKTLEILARVPKMQRFGPKIILKGNWQDHAVAVQTAVTQKCYCSVLNSEHQEFLENLSQMDKCEATLSQWPRWAEILEWTAHGRFGSTKEAAMLRMALEQSAHKLKDKKLYFHRVHGDFAPWHALLGYDGLKVVDWQDSEAMGLPYYDSVHFLLRAISINKSLDIGKLLADPLGYLGLNQDSLRGDSVELIRLAAVYYISSDLHIRRFNFNG